jgi:pyrrolidone-carboxylate peptidase
MKVSSSPCRVLVTAFGPYFDGLKWNALNASQMAVEQLAQRTFEGVCLTTRIYEVNFSSIRRNVELDVAKSYDVIILTGQSSRCGELRFERVARNAGRDCFGDSTRFPLAVDGPAEIGPYAAWWEALSHQGMDARIDSSNDAGDFLCNAAMYFALLAADRRWKSGATLPLVGFFHVPLAPSQVAPGELSMKTDETAEVLALVIEQVASALARKPIN